MNSKVFQNDHIYNGRIKPEDFTSQDVGRMPGINNPYRYYDLPPGYYDYWRPGGGKRSDNSSNKRYNNSTSQRTNNSINQKNNNISMQRNGDYNRKLMETKPQTKELVLSPNKEQRGPHCARALSKRTQDTKFQRQEQKRVDVIPIPTSERQQPHRSSDVTQVISPDILVYNPLYKLKPEPVFPQRISASINDIAKSVPVTRIQPNQVTGNPLIPVLAPGGYTDNHDLSTSSPSPSDLYVSEDDDYDSFSWRFSNVPSYNAIESILMGPDL